MAKRKTNLDPWEKQDHETSKAYAAFCAYRDMGTDRSLAKQAAAVNSELAGSSLTAKVRQLTKWSSKYNWVARVEAYDVYLEENVRRESEAAIQKMAHDHALVASLAIHKGVERIKLIIDGVDGDGNPLPSELTPREAIDFLRIGVDIERKSRGAPDQLVELSGSVVQIIDDIPHGKKDASTTQKSNHE